MKKPELHTALLLLRPVTMDDFKSVHAWASVPENVRWMTWGPNSEQDTRWWLAEAAAKPGYDFAVVLKSTGQVIGSCGIYADEANDTGTLGWILHRDHHGCGYGTEFAQELVRYGFEDLRLRRIIATCAAVNVGSSRIMERAGMRREGLRVKGVWARIDEEWVDRAEYGMLAEEWNAKNQCVGVAIGRPGYSACSKSSDAQCAPLHAR
ncbi:MAG: GNAT family N-acetyltransferase [Oscillospiraceae bacterium]|nr:GNAT family N-acetyltransferase [Oscillospiraceae bacterium]